MDSQKFFDLVIDKFLILIKKGSMNSDILFIKIVDNYILPSFVRYQKFSLKYIEYLFSAFITPELWNNKVFLIGYLQKDGKTLKRLYYHI